MSPPLTRQRPPAGADAANGLMGGTATPEDTTPAAQPTRIQRRRGPRGYRHPQGTVHVTRGTRWGNPYPVADHGRTGAVRLFREYAIDRLAGDPEWLAPLRDARYLACWCKPDEECHADVLIELLGEVAS